MTDKTPEIPLTAAKSSAIAGYGYDAASKTLVVMFSSGKTYRFGDVPAEVHAGFAEAKSVGGYYAKNVAGKFKVVP